MSVFLDLGGVFFVIFIGFYRLCHYQNQHETSCEYFSQSNELVDYHSVMRDQHDAGECCQSEKNEDWSSQIEKTLAIFDSSYIKMTYYKCDFINELH